jgi:hypothetical protein
LFAWNLGWALDRDSRRRSAGGFAAYFVFEKTGPAFGMAEAKP